MSPRRATPDQPLLIPLYGHADRNPRVLDRDVTALGRARGNDLCLDAAEVSTLHCVLYRTPGGYRLRDCGSRTGTRVNGEQVRNAKVSDGDVVQIGPFSFELKLPAPPKEHDPAKVARLEASRLRLGAHLMRLRRCLHAASASGVRQQELDHKAQLLRERVRAYDQRAGQLEAAEEELQHDRQALDRDCEAHRDHVRRVEADLAARLEQAERDIRTRWTEFQQRCLTEQERWNRRTEESPHAAEESLAELLRQSEERSRALAEQLIQMRTHQQEFEAMKTQWQSEHAEAAADVERQRAVLAQQEAALKAQRTEVARMLGDLKRLQADVRKQQRPDVRAVLEENEQLRHLLAECEQRLANVPTAHQVEQVVGELRAENHTLRQLLHEQDATIVQLRHASPADRDAATAPGVAELRTELDGLREEHEILRQLLEEKEKLVVEMQVKATPAVPKTANDLEAYEAELNQFRAQLETDRVRVQDEWEQIKQRNDELDEATREMEMSLSRERAELARERIRVDRMREELKADVERVQREMSVRDTLAPLQKLRDEMQKKPGNGAAARSLNDRLRGPRSGDTPS